MWDLEIVKESKSRPNQEEIVGVYEFSKFMDMVDFVENELQGRCYEVFPLYWTVKYKGKYLAAKGRDVKATPFVGSNTYVSILDSRVW